METIIEAETAAVGVDTDATEFTTTGPFVLIGEGFSAIEERAELYIKGPSDAFIPLTDKEGRVFVGQYPNAIPVDTPGTFRVSKTPTASEVSVAYYEI